MITNLGYTDAKDALSIKWEMVHTAARMMPALKTKSKLQMDIASHAVIAIKSHKMESHVIN
jgi:hypothetical protein